MVIMSSQRSKEDDVQKISTSVFVTNFHDLYRAKDLWNTCKTYGQVVDAYIPNRRSKAGKRFDFVRFIKVFDVERLVNNMCTVWVGRYKLHANVARFQRESLNKHSNQFNDNGTKRDNVGGRMNGDGAKGTANSYAHAVKGTQGQKEVMDDIPSLVLDDSCLKQKVYLLCLLGKVKEFASLTNLKVILAKEFYANIEIKYMEGLWVMIKFQDKETKKMFQSNLAAGTWFSQIIRAHNDFTIDERVTWVEIEGVPCKWWSRNTFSRIASRWGTLLNGDELEDGGFHRKIICICTNMKTVMFESFKMVYHGKVCWARAIEVPGWVPDFEDEIEEKYDSDDGSHEDEVKGGDLGNLKDLEGDSDVEEVPESKFEEESNKHTLKENSVRQSNAQSEDPFDVDASVEAPNILLEKTRENDDKEDGGFVKKQTHLRNEDLNDAQGSICSGHFKKSKVPRTGGSILQLIDELVNVGQTMGYDMTGCLAQKAKKDWVKELCVSHKKMNETVSDYFTMVRGVWVPSGKRLLIILVYASQELSEKKMLWDYLSFVILNWEGEVVTMEDFNEVRNNSERFGLVFNKQGAEVFNSFISNAGLVEVSLGGCSFTWCHKSATKMSKLDRFFIFNNLMCSCPSISSTSLDRYLSDHRPILMREIHYDYGPTPFKFFHYWFEIDGFDKLVEDSWKEAHVTDQNAYAKGADVDVKRRQKVVSLLQEVEKVDSTEVAQKAKIKWAIGGDENSKYYHGVLNKKRGRLAIRGVLVDGIWMESPSLVKNEFFDHFKNRFEQPLQNRIQLERDFLNRITTDQNEDLEREVSREEIKRTVWDCGIDKALGPDGFTFGFYRRYWNLIESDVVKWFFQQGTIPKGGNSFFITLIPKVPNANMVNDFRPISLIGSLYKIIAKILANRLVMVLGDLANEIQSAFVADRHILDGPFISNKLVQWCKKKKKQAMIFKWNQSNIDTITRVLEVFHRASGLRINMNKSKLMGISVDISKVEQAAAKIGCLILKTPFTYLGTRVGGLMSRIQSWNDIIESMVSRLSRWKLKTLSIGEILTLLKSVLGAIPVYHMSIFKVPIKVLQNMESIRSRFFNGADINSKNPSCVRWKNVMASKDTSGLGVSSLFTLNRALIFKWVWRFISQKSSLWASVIKALHDVASKLSHGGLEFSFRRNPRGGVEQAQLELLKEKVEGCILSNMNYRWAWPLEGSGKFSVSSVRKVIDATLLPKGTTKTRGMKIESMLCPMCDNAVESSRHLFFSCHFISELMRKITRWWDMDYMEINSFEEWLEWVSSIRLLLKQKTDFRSLWAIATIKRNNNQPKQSSESYKRTRIRMEAPSLVGEKPPVTTPDNSDMITIDKNMDPTGDICDGKEE
nr:RNA-directed DNA polymerase, eukaryota [Tanacetum cinerariifolium]